MQSASVLKSDTLCKALTAVRDKGQQKPLKVKIAKGRKKKPTPFPDCAPQPDSITVADSADEGL